MKTNPSTTIHDLIQALAFATDMVEDVMVYHGWRVAVFGDWLACVLAQERRQQIFNACVLHDIGGVGLPNHILHHLAARDPVSKREILAHPFKGATLISGIPGLFQAAKLVMDHHERYDGIGYPRQKSGSQIAVGAQIIGISDELDTALHSGRVQSEKDVAALLERPLKGKFAQDVIDAARYAWTGKPLPIEIPVNQWIDTYFRRALSDIGPLHIETPGDTLNTTLEVFADIIDAKHPSTSGHSRRVARYSVMIGLAMDLSVEDITLLRWASLLHDIGKLSVPSRVLDKPTLLTEKEYTSMKRHVEYTKAILDRINGFERVSGVAYSHHERWNGSGYPLGLSGDEIPILGRILAVADTFDAMTSGRAYRAGLHAEDACSELQRNAGLHFDPEVIEASVPILYHLAD